MGNANGPEMQTKETYSVKVCKDTVNYSTEYSKEQKGTMGSISFASDAISSNTVSSTLRSLTEQGLSYFTGGSTGGSTEVAVKKE